MKLYLEEQELREIDLDDFMNTWIYENMPESNFYYLFGYHKSDDFSDYSNIIFKFDDYYFHLDNQGSWHTNLFGGYNELQNQNYCNYFSAINILKVFIEMVRQKQKNQNIYLYGTRN